MSQVDAQSRSSFRTFLFGACTVVFAALVTAGFDGSRDLARLKAREDQLEVRLRRTESSIVELRERITRLRSDPHALERVAREDLGLARPGEIVVILPRADNDPEPVVVSEPSDPAEPAEPGHY